MRVLNWTTLPGPIERVLSSDIEHLPRFTSLPGQNGGVSGLHSVSIAECGVFGTRSNNCPDTPWLPTDTGLNDANQIITQATQQGTGTTDAASSRSLSYSSYELAPITGSSRSK